MDIKKIKNFNSNLIRYIAVGVFNTLLGYIIMLILFNMLDFTYTLSYLISYLLGMIISFFLMRSYVFNSKEKPYQKFILFLMVFIVSYLCSYIVLYLLVEYQIYSTNVSFLLSMTVYSILSYILNKLITFR